jgi:hypothetical protein
MFIILFVTFSLKSMGQGYNEEKVAFTNFLKRMYVNVPFDGVKIIDDYNQPYLVSFYSLDPAKYPNASVMNRIAQVKAQSQVSTFLNGANISMDLFISTKETKDSLMRSTTIIETIEVIKQNSTGFSQGLELLTNFVNEADKKMVFIYARELSRQ